MYQEILCNFENIYKAYKLAHHGKRNDVNVIQFDRNKMYNLQKILYYMQTKQWDKIFNYYRFKLYEPKERIVDAMTFEGRIVQHVLCDLILRPYFEPRLIKENCACRIDKGTDYALNLLQQGLIKQHQLNSNFYILKIDVKKFFPSIDRKILKSLISVFPDKEIIEFMNWLIDNAPEKNGIPIGNQTSQWFALFYLNAVDHQIKEKHHVKCYVRYMDDLILTQPSKQQLITILQSVEDYAGRNLALIFNGKTQILKCKNGVNFLGWHFLFQGDKLVKHIEHSKVGIRKRHINKMYTNYKCGMLNDRQFKEQKVSYFKYLKRGDTYQFCQKYLYKNAIDTFNTIKDKPFKIDDLSFLILLYQKFYFLKIKKSKFKIFKNR